ncbi:MAG: response regulator [Arcobacteraceae bacterium]
MKDRKIDPKELKNITILYVEDDVGIRTQMSQVLNKLFKKAYVGIDGADGIVVYKKYMDEIDVVVTDINMPNINGLDMVKKINTLNKSIATIVTSADSDSSNILNAIDMNIDKYIQKPLQIKELTVSIVDLVLKYRRMNNIESLAKNLIQKTTKDDKEHSQLQSEIFRLRNHNVYLNSLVKKYIISLRIDKKGNIIEISSKFEKCFGYENILGKNINILEDENCTQESIQKLMLKTIHIKENVSSSYTLVGKNDNKISGEIMISAVYGKDALVNGYMVYFDLI